MKLRVLLDRFRQVPTQTSDPPWTGIERRRLPASRFQASAAADTTLVDARLSDLRQQRARLDDAIYHLEVERPMSAAIETVALREPITLRLTASRQMPRKLVVCWRHADAIVMLYRATSAPPLCFAQAELDACRLRHGADGHTELWIGSASFDLTALEAKIVQGTLGPYGLVRRDGP